MWDLITAALSSYGQNLMNDPMLTAGKGLFDNIMKPKDPSIDPYKPEQPAAYDEYGTLKPPPPNPYADLLSAASQPKPQTPALSMPPLPPMQSGPVVSNLGMSQMQPNMPLYRQAYGRYF